jgi:hypothetical protein
MSAGDILMMAGEEIRGISKVFLMMCKEILSPRDGLCNPRGKRVAERREKKEMSRVEV